MEVFDYFVVECKTNSYFIPFSLSLLQYAIAVTPGDKWCQGKLEFMLSQRGKPLLVHDGHSFGIQYIRKDKKYWQCNLSRKYNCKARVTTTDTGEIIVTNNEHCHTEIRQHLKKEYKNKLMMGLNNGRHSNGNNERNVASTLSAGSPDIRAMSESNTVNSATGEGKRNDSVTGAMQLTSPANEHVIGESLNLKKEVA